MKVLSLLTVTALLACASMATAQTNEGQRPGGRRGMNVDQRIEMMSTNLNLTAEQKTKVRAVLEEQQKSMQQQGNSDLSPEERRAQWTKQREEVDKKLKAILKEDQYKKYEETRPMRGGPGGQGKGKQGQDQGKGKNKA